MFITLDSKVNIGYIYLQPPKKNNPIWNEKDNSNLRPYLEGDISEIPLILDDREVQKGVSNLTLNEKTYFQDLDVEFEEEYLNDKESEYITGIELNLTKQEFVNLIKDKVFKLYELEYLNKKFLFLTLDYLDNVLEPNNIIYPASTNMNEFYVVSIEDGICYIKAIIFSKEGLYDTEYIITPMFILYE